MGIRGMAIMEGLIGTSGAAENTPEAMVVRENEAPLEGRDEELRQLVAHPDHADNDIVTSDPDVFAPNPGLLQEETLLVAESASVDLANCDSDDPGRFDVANQDQDPTNLDTVHHDPSDLDIKSPEAKATYMGQSHPLYQDPDHPDQSDVVVVVVDPADPGDEEETVVKTQVMRDPTDVSSLRLLAEVIVPFALAGLGMVFAGVLLSKIQVRFEATHIRKIN